MTTRLSSTPITTVFYALERCWGGKLLPNAASRSCDKLVGLMGGAWRLTDCSNAFARGGLFSHRGPRHNNEDAGLVAVAPGRFIAVAVADGVGGLRSGEVASYRAVCVVLRELLDVAGHLGGFSQDWFRQLFDTAHEEVAKATQGGATTLVVAVYDLTSHMLHVAHVGDSVAYMVLERGDGQAEYGLLTQDLDEATDAGGSYITQAVGHRSYRGPHYYLYNLAGFKSFLKIVVAVSDGVDDFINKEYYRRLPDLFRKKKSAREVAKTLVHSAIMKGGRDNATAAVAIILPRT